MSPSPVEVVSAAIIRRDPGGARILLAQRSPDTSYPWAWCTPGGKVDPGETHEAALRRELREELGVELEQTLNLPLFIHNIHSTKTSAWLAVLCYRVDWRSIHGVPVDGDKTAGIGWFRGRDLDRIDMAPADRAGVEALQRALAEH